MDFQYFKGKLKDFSTKAPKGFEKEETKLKTAAIRSDIADWQNKLFAEHEQSLLVVFQGMDASGKDGAVKNVFSGVNPQGCRVYSFKKPTQEEMDHDFLWRVHEVCPAKGMIHVFNRSHYEDVLITRVHGWVDDNLAKKRFKWINSFEDLIQERGTTVLKFYLHISPEGQQKEIAERLEDPEKNWKYNAADLEEAKLWDDYMNMYEDVFKECNEVPWHIVPTDNRWYKDFYIAKVILETLEKMNPKFPINESLQK